MENKAHREEVQQLFVRHISPIKGFILGLCPDFSEADDILQEVFMTVTRKADDFELGTNFQAWARAIARNKVLEHLKKSTRLACPLDEETLDAVAAEAEPVEDAWERQRRALMECLEKIAPHARKLMELRYVNGRLPGEIAAAMSWTLGSVNVGLARVRKSLRDCTSHKLLTGEPG
jgi:RNA polymerase sigma-70 factor (ECF subfamily)